MADIALNLRRAYADICRGYSPEIWRGKSIYIKHLTHYDQVDIDVYYDEALESAKARGIKTREERLKWLENKKLWLRKDDSELSMQRSYVENLEKTRNKMFLKSQIDQMTITLEEARTKLYTDTIKKENLIGLTCEKVAEQKIQFHYIYLAFFKNKELTKNVFDLESLKQLEDDESDELISFYIGAMERLSLNSIKKIALAPYFTNNFYLCADSIYHFFSKPISELSNYQTNLLSYGSYYKTLLSQNQVPDDVRENPDKLEEYINKTKNFKDAISKTGGDGSRVGIVGATNADFEALGIENSSKSIQEAAGKNYTNSMDAAKEMGVTWL